MTQERAENETHGTPGDVPPANPQLPSADPGTGRTPSNLKIRKAAPKATAEATGRGTGGSGKTDRSGPGRALLCLRPTGPIRVFLVAGTRLTFGRRKSDHLHGRNNDVILRRLPCRDARRDLENFAATRRIAGAHGEFAIREGEGMVRDRSSRGTFLDGARIERRTWTPLPDSFELGIGTNALRLRGTVLRAPLACNLAPGGAAGTIRAIVLERIENAPEHRYVLLAGELRIGNSTTADIRLSAWDGHDLVLTNHEGALHIALPNGSLEPLALSDPAAARTWSALDVLPRHFTELDVIV